MTTAEARAEFNKLIARQTDPDLIARLELCREYFTNPTFRRGLADFVWSLNRSADVQ